MSKATTSPNERAKLVASELSIREANDSLERAQGDLKVEDPTDDEFAELLEDASGRA